MIGKQERDDGTYGGAGVSDEDICIEALSNDAAGQGKIVEGEKGPPRSQRRLSSHQRVDR